MEQESSSPVNFIKNIIEDDQKSGKFGGRVVTRFPPEPNGYLHIGHAKSMCLNFGLAKQYGGKCNLRYDDTNPAKEEEEFVHAIERDVHWMGYDWGDRKYFASDYFPELYKYAVELIKMGKAYVDSMDQESIRKMRGTLKQGGKESPFRNRSIKENLELFDRMKNCEFQEGEHVLRAKIDMNSPNINMRDPVIYRILKTVHHRTGDQWCIFPMYDFTHCISDALEGVTHSLCTLEFEDHRPLYDWFLDELKTENHPQQIEFARLNLSYTVLSKRKLTQLVEKKLVNGWDDPRMPTLAGLRRRGYTSASIRKFCDMIGVAKADNLVDIAMLEFAIREDLNQNAQRRIVVSDPVKLIIDNYPEDQEETLEAANNPEKKDSGTRQIPFSRELYIEREDFMEDPPKKYFRLAPGKEVRLVHAYYVTCTNVVKDPSSGEISEIHCNYDPKTRGGWSEDGRKVKGTIHWVEAKNAVKVRLNIYDHLFSRENLDNLNEEESFTDFINPDSLQVIPEALAEPSLLDAPAGEHYQFLRKGYFILDTPTDGRSVPETAPTFNKTVGLKDSWAKIAKKN